MKKVLFTLLIVLCIGTFGFGQSVTFNPSFYQGGVGFYGYLPLVDTLKISTYNTSEIDVSAFDGQTMYLTYDYYSPATTGADTLFLIVQSKVNDGTTSMTINLDTLTITNTSTSTPTQQAFSFWAFSPTIKFLIRPNYYQLDAQETSRDGTLKLFVYMRQMDALYKFNSSWY